jgi:uncharacterized protein (DUF1800 family)
MSTHDAVTALRRFGLGARPGEIKRIANDPRGFVLQSLSHKQATLVNDAGLDPSHVTLATIQLARRQQKLAREMKREAAIEGAQKGPGGDAGTGQQSAKITAEPAPGTKMVPELKPGKLASAAYTNEASVRFECAAATDDALLERLVMFWSNHFCVSAIKGAVRALAGAYEREAIRPYVLGRYADMLMAVEHHPAMLIYLDNQVSTGPNSQAGRNQHRGLNENLAREILELHTLGVDGGYTQSDVTNFARIITGWTVGNVNQPITEPGKFFYAAARHEPGEWTVVGKPYPDDGQRSGEMVLTDLARHPSTARHIARKIAKHFVSDDPSPTLVARLESTFRESDGDLGAIATALVACDDAWAPTAQKVVPPYDFLVSIVRGLAPTPKLKPGELLRLANLLGQPLWQPPAPAGWPDDDNVWAGPSAVRERLRIAEMLARQIDPLTDPRTLADDLFGEALGDATRQAIARAETREQGFEILMMSPEFQRR